MAAVSLSGSQTRMPSLNEVPLTIRKSASVPPASVWVAPGPPRRR